MSIPNCELAGKKFKPEIFFETKSLLEDQQICHDIKYLTKRISGPNFVSGTKYFWTTIFIEIHCLFSPTFFRDQLLEGTKCLPGTKYFLPNFFQDQ